MRRKARGAGNGKRLDLAGVAVHVAERRHCRVDPSANEVLQRGRLALVRHVHGVDAGCHVEQLADEVTTRAWTIGAIGELAGPCLGERHVLLERRGRQALANAERDRRESQHSDRLQVFEPIARLRHQHRVAEKRAVADQHGVSVRRRLRHRGCGDGAARTGPGFDDAGLAPGVGQLLANDPHHGVVVPARRRRNHELDDL